jgi:hypothetical protein
MWQAAGSLGTVATSGRLVGQPPAKAKNARRPAAKAAPAIERPQDGLLREGDMAPDFQLKSVDGKADVRLSNFRSKQPVVLIFGSYT